MIQTISHEIVSQFSVSGSESEPACEYGLKLKNGEDSYNYL
jgi:hypothetical protein